MRLSESTAQELRKNLKIYSRTQLQEEQAERLGVAKAVSCKNKFWDEASEQDAIDQLLYKASLAGGTGITDVTCESEGTNFAKNCWSSYTCHAGIVRVGSSGPRASGRVGASSGTGIAVSTEGHILTNSHVVHGAKFVSVTFGGEVLPATVVREDAQNDLAILKVERRTIPLAFRDDGRIRSGDPVTIIGFPLSAILSKEPHVTTGSVTALSGIKDDARFLQVSAPVQPGNSGGPVLDDSGRVIGVTVAQLDALKLALVTGTVPQNVNFAIKASIAKAFLDAVGVNYIVDPKVEPRSVSDAAEKARPAVVSIESR
jgi:S1-C subfamily serine protease